METTSIKKVDSVALEQKVKKMYSDVALNPTGEYHFEMGLSLAEKLGYKKIDLDRIPSASIESFAGVGYYFDMADLKEGNLVLDLGSGSGMDSFIAALKVGASGKITGVDMTDEQLEKAERLRKEWLFTNVSFCKSYIERLPFPDGVFDAVISNGVINLSPDKVKVFAEVSRILKPGGKMVIADIVTEKQLPENITCNSTLWAACIGGASQQDDYRSIIEKAGMEVTMVRNNEAYSFISKSAKGASQDYGVKSVSLCAKKKIISPLKRATMKSILKNLAFAFTVMFAIPLNAQEVQPMLGQPAPPFALNALNGKAYSLEQLKGKYIVIHFATTWCPFCNAEAPNLEKLFKEYREKGVEVFIVDVAEGKDLVEKSFSRFNFSFPILLDADGKVSASYAPEGVQPDLERQEVPIASNLIIDKEGKIRFYSLLNTTAFDAKLTKLKQKLDELIATGK